MDKELIEKLAWEGADIAVDPYGYEGPTLDQLVRFASLIAEESAKVAEAKEPCGGPYVHDIARAIRAKFSLDPTP